MDKKYTVLFRGYKVEHYANAESGVVYTDYCYTPKMYAELCKKHDGLIRNAGPVRNVKVPNEDEFRKIVELTVGKASALE